MFDVHYSPSGAKIIWHLIDLSSDCSPLASNGERNYHSRITDSAEKPNPRRCFNFPAHATYDKYVSFSENSAPCISDFLSGIMFQDFCSVIITVIKLTILNLSQNSTLNKRKNR
jgi:hypothetical protein